MLYCCALWEGAYKSYIDNLVEEKIISIMSRCQRYENTHPLFISHKLFNLQIYVLICTWGLVFFPVNCNFNILERNDTRRANNLRIPPCITSDAQQSIVFSRPKQWKLHPQEITKTTPRPVFRHKLKTMLLTTYN